MIYTDRDKLVIEVKKIMLEKGISQKALADKLGIMPQSLVKVWEKKNFSFEDLKKICDALGVDFDITFQSKGL